MQTINDNICDTSGICYICKGISLLLVSTILGNIISHKNIYFLLNGMHLLVFRSLWKRWTKIKYFNYYNFAIELHYLQT